MITSSTHCLFESSQFNLNPTSFFFFNKLRQLEVVYQFQITFIFSAEFLKKANKKQSEKKTDKKTENLSGILSAWHSVILRGNLTSEFNLIEKPL